MNIDSTRFVIQTINKIATGHTEEQNTIQYEFLVWSGYLCQAMSTLWFLSIYTLPVTVEYCV